ncbi:MAG: OmpA family protein [Candidatus Kapabacteria bacterium]|nr:OmpA family protein [Candidatus Kapabacteria bacterium]
MRPLIAVIFLISLLSCKSSHKLSQEFDLRDDGERMSQTRYVATRSIDSVDINALKTDVWKLEHYSYPDSIRLFVRVLDTNGFVVTNMAAPYKRDGAPDYFPILTEQLGVRRKARKVDVPTFRVREFGERDSIPTNIALAIDCSGSMKGAKETIDLGTELFIEMKRARDNISLTAYHKEIRTVFPLSSDTGAMLREFREYKKYSQGLFTATYDGILKTLQTLKDVPLDQPKVCVVFSDGDENLSTVKVGDIFEYATKHNISIYCVGFGYAQDEPLQDLSLYTGGKYYRAYTKKDLLSIFLDIYRSLRNYYLVTYTPPRYEGLHTVDLTVRVPGRDTMIARGVYDKTPLTPIDPRDEFSKLILFAFNKSDIDTASYHILEELSDALERFENVVLEVQGHTDNIGTEEYNQTLSQARAESVKSALVNRGVDATRLRTRGMGFMMPVVPNDSEENRAKNRRTVFRILRK